MRKNKRDCFRMANLFAIHSGLNWLNKNAVELAALITRNFEETGT